MTTSIRSCRSRHAAPAARGVQVLNDATTNWTIGPCPTVGWAEMVHPRPRAEAALHEAGRRSPTSAGSTAEIPSPPGTSASTSSCAVVGSSTGWRLDRLRFEGPGTDLTVGLLPCSRLAGGEVDDYRRRQHRRTSPPRRCSRPRTRSAPRGRDRDQAPAALRVDRGAGSSVRFEGGRAVEIDADQGGRGHPRRCWPTRRRAPRLGEVALVDRDGRIGPLDTVFYDTLLDENAASHIALGQGLDLAVARTTDSRVNRSASTSTS